MEIDMDKVFIAFTGPKVATEKMLLIEEGFECWNLDKFSFDEFIVEVKTKIPPVNNNVNQKGYKRESQNDGRGMLESEFKKGSWGLLLSIPSQNKEGFGITDRYSEALFLINLYSPSFLRPIFYVNDGGINQWGSMCTMNNCSSPYHDQNQYGIFSSKKFVKFFKALSPQCVYGTLNRDEFEKWKKEDWRLGTASLLYQSLIDYESGKNGVTWQREAAEMMTILETLFTASDKTNSEVGYRLRKRVATLVGYQFPDIEKDITKIYDERSAFVHGDFFASFAKQVPKLKEEVTGLPLPDFDFLYKHKEYVRLIFVAYLYLSLKVKSGDFPGYGGSVDVLEKGIIDLSLREKVVNTVKEIFDTIPKEQFSLRHRYRPAA